MEENPPTERRRTSRPGPSFNSPGEPAPAERAPRRPGQAAPPVTFQPPGAENHPGEGPTRRTGNRNRADLPGDARPAEAAPTDTPAGVPSQKRPRPPKATRAAAKPAPPRPAKATAPAERTSNPAKPPSSATADPTPGANATADPAPGANAAVEPAPDKPTPADAAPEVAAPVPAAPAKPRAARKAAPRKAAVRKAQPPASDAVTVPAPAAAELPTAPAPEATEPPATSEPKQPTTPEPSPAPAESPAARELAQTAAELTQPAAMPTQAPTPATPSTPDSRPRLRATPKQLAITAVQMLGPRAQAWADETRTAYPTATPEALARLAIRQFTRFGSLAGFFGALAGSYAPVALVGGAALTDAALTLHLAAAYGLDPTDPQRAADLLVIMGVHASTEEAEAAEETGRGLFPLARMVAAQTAPWAVARLVSKRFPGTTVLAAVLAGRTTADATATRATAYYRRQIQLSQESGSS